MTRRRIAGNDLYLEHRNRNAVLDQGDNKVTIERADLLDVMEALGQIAVAEGLVCDVVVEMDASDHSVGIYCPALKRSVRHCGRDCVGMECQRIKEQRP